MNRHITSTLLICLASTSIADELALIDGSELTGEVISMTSEGTLVLESPNALNPLEIRASNIRRVNFTDAQNKSLSHDARVSLINGDNLPCDLLSIDDQSVKVDTDFAGILELDRSAVSRIQLGLKPRRVLMNGVSSKTSWTLDDDWRISGDALRSNGRGSATTKVDELPTAFSVSFDVSWKNRPHMTFLFGGEKPDAANNSQTRYALEFGLSGFELKRIGNSGQSQTLGWVNRKPTDFRDKQVQVDVRCDRESRIIWLYIDGELEGRFLDPSEEIPAGNYITFKSSSDNRDQNITKLRVREWDSIGDRHRSEDRGENTSDVIIDNDGQRFNGDLLETTKEDGDNIVLFKIRHHDQPLHIPLKLTSTLFLATAVENKSDPALRLQISSNGMLSAKNCELGNEFIKLSHPLIGDLRINRDAAVAFVRNETEGNDE